MLKKPIIPQCMSSTLYPILPRLLSTVQGEILTEKKWGLHQTWTLVPYYSKIWFFYSLKTVHFKEGSVFLEFSCHLQASPICFLWIIHHLQMEPRPSITNIKLLKARPWSNTYKSVCSNWRGIKCLVSIRWIWNPCLEIFLNRDFKFIPSSHKYIWWMY